MANNRELSQFANVIGYNGGKIGIGTVTPGEKLSVEDSSPAVLINATNASGESKLQFGRTGNTNVGEIKYDHSNNAFTFRTNDTADRLRIDSSGRILQGLTSAKLGFFNDNNAAPVHQIQGDNYYKTAFSIFRDGSGASGPNFILAKGREAIVQDNDILGTISFQGHDGTTELIEGASIVTEVDGTPGANDVPSALIFKTNSGTSSTAERLRIDSSGRLLVGHSANVAPDGYESLIQTSGTDYRGGSLSIRRDQNTSSGPALLLTKTRSGSIGGTTLVSNGDALGTIWFYGADGNDVNQAGAKIECNVDYTAGSNNMPGRLAFHVTSDGAASPTERMRIDSAGRVLMANVGSYYSSGEVLSLSTSNNGSVQVMRNTNASFNNSLIFGYTSRSSNSAFQYAKFAANAASDTDFVLRGDGNAYADGSWYTGGADYAEYFEWSDGNASDEDRRGISVVLDGDKIREAVAGEDPIGVISGNPSVVGDAAWNKWNGKYLRDDFGTYIQEDYEVEDEDGNTVVQQRRQLNSAWSSENEYVTREDRAEWDTVGLMGKLRIRKGQVTGTRWIKMRDISDTVEEWLVR
tara:strand:+ start:355 stop:2091 length:1737 start_codon:yes stop_codon:yes gene_type:complete